MNCLLKVHLSVSSKRYEQKEKIIQYPGPRFRGKESLFLFSENVGYQNSRTAIQNLKKNLGVEPRAPVFGKRMWKLPLLENISGYATGGAIIIF